MSLPPRPSASGLDAALDTAAQSQSHDGVAATVTSGCPYLAADGRGWRSATADRDHRCTAVAPPALLTLDKQRRLCLVDNHATCATYLAAVATHPHPAPSAGGASREHVTRWAITRATPVVLDRSRWPAAVSALSPFRRGGQITLGGLMVVASLAVLGGRLTDPDGRPAGAVEASPSASASAPGSVARTPAPRSSRAPVTSPSLPPTLVNTPVPTPAPTPAPTLITYAVKSGDTLSAIASRHGTTVAAIVELNSITDPSRLRIGQVLQIPAPSAP